MRGRRTLLVCLAALSALTAASTARAAYDPLESGATVLKLDKRLLGLLRAHDVELATREGAVFRGGKLRFPVAGGRFDPVTEKGTVEHAGTVLFEREGRAVSLQRLQLKTTRRSSPLVAKVGGGQLKLGTARRLVVSRQGFADVVSVSTLRLSAKVAARLSRRLRLQGVFAAGTPIGSVVTKANPETVTILGKGVVSFELDPGIASKLDDLHVAVNPIFPAERPGLFTLPIAGGRLAPDLSRGFLQLQGGMDLLQLGGGQVIWSEFLLDLDNGVLSPEVDVRPSPPYAGKVGLQAVATLGLPSGAIAVDPGPRTLAASGAVLKLTDSTAATFNEIFAKPQGKQGIFAAGEILGRLSFLAVAQ
jgi:hypothetical protein